MNTYAIPVLIVDMALLKSALHLCCYIVRQRIESVDELHITPGGFSPVVLWIGSATLSESARVAGLQ